MRGERDQGHRCGERADAALADIVRVDLLVVMSSAERHGRAAHERGSGSRGEGEHEGQSQAPGAAAARGLAGSAGPSASRWRGLQPSSSLWRSCARGRLDLEREAAGGERVQTVGAEAAAAEHRAPPRFASSARASGGRASAPTRARAGRSTRAARTRGRRARRWREGPRGVEPPAGDGPAGQAAQRIDGAQDALLELDGGEPRVEREQQDRDAGHVRSGHRRAVVEVELVARARVVGERRDAEHLRSSSATPPKVPRRWSRGGSAGRPSSGPRAARGRAASARDGVLPILAVGCGPSRPRRTRSRRPAGPGHRAAGGVEVRGPPQPDLAAQSRLPVRSRPWVRRAQLSVLLS